MKWFQIILSPFLICAMVPSYGSARANQEEITQTLDKVVAQYNRFKTSTEWFAACEKNKCLNTTDLQFFRNEVARTSTKLLPIKRVGTDLKMGDSSSQVLIKFGGIQDQKIEINNHVISFKGLTSEQLYRKIEEAIPKKHASHFSLLPEAHANPVLIVAGVGIATALVLSTYADSRISRGTQYCENALTNPLFRSPPATDEAQNKMSEMIKEVNSWQTWLTDTTLTWNPNIAQKFKDCLARLKDRHDQLVPVKPGSSDGGSR